MIDFIAEYLVLMSIFVYASIFGLIVGVLADLII